MDRTTKIICGLLQNPNHMRRCAAAITLAELAPKDATVVRALGEALQDANPMMIPYVLEALEAIGSPVAVPYVLPLLDSGEIEIKLRAAAIVSRAGNAVVPQILERIAQAAPAQKPVLADVLARIHTREAFRAILALLFDPDFELVKAVCAAVRRHIADVAPKDRAVLHKEVLRFMAAPRVAAQERVLTSCLLLLGSIARPEARTPLLKYAAPKASLYVRRHALIGLQNLELTGAAARAVARQILPYLDEADEGLVRHALDLLGGSPWPGASAPWPKLLASAHPAVRSFAAHKLAADDTAASNRELVRLLRHEDTEVRETAASALATHEGATRLLLEVLAGEADTDAAWRLAKILKPHSAAVDKVALKQFAAQAARDLQAGNLRHEALLYFLRNVDPRAGETVLLAAGRQHRQAGQWAQAVECLRRLVGTETCDDEVRYELSVCNLKVSPKDLTPHVRAEDHALRGIQGLLRNKAFKLLDRVKKDKTLDAADLYYLGFHFAEATTEDREFGRELLAHVAKRWPKSEQGKAAKHKAKLP